MASIKQTARRAVDAKNHPSRMVRPLHSKDPPVTQNDSRFLSLHSPRVLANPS
jgi:hypothetical protein